jgi:hypothetical protein
LSSVLSRSTARFSTLFSCFRRENLLPCITQVVSVRK